MKALCAYRPAPFLLAAVLFLASGCRQIDGPHEAVPHEAAEIPMYTQLLLKGDVRNIRDSIVVQGHPELTDIIDMTFDENSNLESYMVNGDMRAADPEPVHLQYEHTKTHYAFFVYPDIWHETDSMSDYGISVRDGVETMDTLRIDTSWDRDGRFTRVRCRYNGELKGISSIMGEDGEMVPVEGNDVAIENYLYDVNGYPRYRFYFEYDGAVILSGLFRFENPDSQGNPQVIHATVSPDWEFTIFREIVYRIGRRPLPTHGGQSKQLSSSLAR